MPPTDPSHIAKTLLATQNCTLVSCKTIQRLWAGYGSICAVTARAESDEAAHQLREVCFPQTENKNENHSSRPANVKAGDTFRLILKLISPPAGSGVNSARIDEGHLRKMFSYEVELFFYTKIVPRLGEIGVARCFVLTETLDADTKSTSELGQCMAILMADLRNSYPVSGEKRSFLSSAQVLGSLDWLAAFHARSWDLGIGFGADRETENGNGYILPPLDEHALRMNDENKSSQTRKNVWLNGGYTYLSTRRKEYSSLVKDDSEWSDAFCEPFSSSINQGLSTAEMAALALTPRGRPIESLIHGDVKSENLFTTESGADVAFFDFQYVGLGLGVCDLAKLFTCSVPLDMLLQSTGTNQVYGDELPESLPMGSGEKALLERYRDSLLRGKSTANEDVERSYDWDTFVRHWETALVDWCRFQASWGFWGNTEWLEARVRFILADEGWRKWLENDVRI